MTIERKLIFGLDDIKAIVFECCACHSRVSISPQIGRQMRIPSECPQCQAKWSLLDPVKYGDQVATPHVNFVTSIQRLMAFTEETTKASGFTVLLELQEPTAL
jgi:hypothetical protein